MNSVSELNSDSINKEKTDLNELLSFDFLTYVNEIL